uniref:Uncharacterized protein n=1 Tax=Oryza nivara TaxID=4536 RepID=A0A0E0G0R9_ORYNI
MASSRVVVAVALLVAAVLAAFAVLAPACEGARVMREGAAVVGKMSSYQPPVRHKPPVPPSGPSHRHNKRATVPRKRKHFPPSGPSYHDPHS